MEQRGIKIYFQLFLGLGLSLTSLQAQTVLSVKTKTGIETPFTLSSVAKLTFSSGNMIVNKKDVTTSTFAISDVQNLNFGLKTAVSDITSAGNMKLSLYPIPALDNLNVQYVSNTCGEAQFQIIDLNGKVVLQQAFSCQIGTNNQTLSVSHLKHGLYLCRLIQGIKLETTKFLKD